MEKLRRSLAALDGGSYNAYKSIKGNYQFPDYQLSVDHVQGDPFAAPSRLSAVIPMRVAAIPEALWRQQDTYHIRRIAIEDYLNRCFAQAIKRHVRGHRGSGGSGEIGVVACHQQILPRNSVLLRASELEIRFTLGLPAQGRRADGRQAIIMFFEELPKLMSALYYANLDSAQMWRHISSAEDQMALREFIRQQGDMAFIADHSVLPRESGISDRPLKKQALAFASPKSLRKTVNLPHAGEISGMAIPPGITLIVGGGYHGKSTLLNALEMGIYQHIPGDGREKVVTMDNAVKIRAEDGRAINLVNINPFINNLPFNRDTTTFSTENASGSTSQAANIIEALQCQSQLLLIDEDTSATNFMIRDELMQQLVAKDKEPITPLLFRVRELYEKHSVSSIIVMGGSGDYFDIADTVIMMDNYLPQDVTEKAKSLARTLKAECDSLPPFALTSSRKPGRTALDASRGKREVKIDAQGTHLIRYGEYDIDMRYIEQLIDVAQTRSIGLIIHYYAERYATRRDMSLQQGLLATLSDIHENGIDIISPYKVGNLAYPRLFDVVAAINRIRSDNWLLSD